jgi:hypothetical protein
MTGCGNLYALVTALEEGTVTFEVYERAQLPGVPDTCFQRAQTTSRAGSDYLTTLKVAGQVRALEGRFRADPATLRPIDPQFNAPGPVVANDHVDVHGGKR